MEVSLIMPVWLKHLFCAAADQFESVIIGLKACLPAGDPAADVIDLIPEVRIGLGRNNAV